MLAGYTKKTTRAISESLNYSTDSSASYFESLNIIEPKNDDLEILNSTLKLQYFK